MKLEKILDGLNSFEKNAFLKIVDGIIADKPKNAKEIDKILSDKSKELREQDNINVANVFVLVEDEFAEHIKTEFVNATSQLDILTDIIIKDGSCIMKRDWFARLYENELRNIDKKQAIFRKSFDSESPSVDEQRKRDYETYRACLETAYSNDLEANQDAKITTEEQSVLLILSQSIQLRFDEPF